MGDDHRDLRGKVGDVTRAVIDAAGQAHLSPTEWRALIGIVYFTVTYGRSTDRVTTLRIAQHVGINPDGTERVRMRETGRALRGLRDKHLIVYEPARREGSASLVGVHPTVLGRVSVLTPQGVGTHTERVSVQTPQGVSPRTNRVSAQTTSQGKPSKGFSQGDDAARASGTASSPIDACRACGTTSGLEELGNGGVLCGDCGTVTRAA